MHFEEGDQLSAIIFDADEQIVVGDSCDSIIVVMENGQMAAVPWFEVWKDGKCTSKWNAAEVQGVVFT